MLSGPGVRVFQVRQWTMPAARRGGAALLALASWCVAAAALGADESGGPLPPVAALARFVVPEDLQIDLVLAEPQIEQPVFLHFDERGRMWVVEYRQYPFPAGLNMVSHDKFWRAVYDKVPPPPPRQFVGKDRITIHEDADADGVFESHKTFVDGLNIVTACAIGRGGVWVLNPPYLLFYADANHDDVPDGDPQVMLEGFGLEDTHSVVNSLTFGPDGWLYAAQGSTVTANVRRPQLAQPGVPSMGQLIWRFHPETRRYEIFAEGGGNAFGVEVDAKGRLFSGHNGGDTRGFHYVQGGYSQKGFNKHGPLSNPYAFGYFPPMKHHAAPRFTHAFVIYDGNGLPPRFAGKLFGVAPMLNQVVLSEVLPDGTTFRTKDLAAAVATTDTWFRPVDIKIGPDGGLYIADWYDGQINHYRNHEGRIDRAHGRVYRLRARAAPTRKPPDLGQLDTRALLALLNHDNRWQRQTALRLLGDRRDPVAVPELQRRLSEERGPAAITLFWALNQCGGFDEAAAIKALEHADPFVRLWAVRLVGDERNTSSAVAARLAQIAAAEPNAEVRSQLAATARRLPAREGLAIVKPLLNHAEDSADPHIPLLVWWAIEARCATDRDAVFELFREPAVWGQPLVREHLLPRLMRRFAATGHRSDLLTCARLFELSPDTAGSQRLLTGFEQAFQGRALPPLPVELITALDHCGGGSPALDVRRGKPEAIAAALEQIVDPKIDRQHRQELVRIFGEVHEPKCVPRLLELIRGEDDDLKIAALGAAAAYNDATIVVDVLKVYPRLAGVARETAQTLLASRPAWALGLVEAVAAGKVARDSISPEVVRRMTVYRNDRLAELIQTQWGRIEGATTDEMKTQIERARTVLDAGTGDPYSGKKLFVANCAKCHTLFGQGGQIGPDLTAYQRNDLSHLLLGIVNPSAEIREGFQTMLVVTTDGRTASGLLIDQDEQVVVLRESDGQAVTIARSQVDELVPQQKSLMPERLLNNLTDQQVRDLFSYLRSTQPLND